MKGLVESEPSQGPRAAREGWQSASLGEVLPLRYGKAKGDGAGYPRAGTLAFGSNGPFSSVDRALTNGPTIVIGRKGAAGAVHYSPVPCWPTDTAFYSEGDESTHLPFFRYLLESVGLNSLDRSTAIPSLSRDDYNSIVVSYPPSPIDQSKVAGHVEEQFSRLDAGIAALRRAQANLKRYRASVLKAACEGRLVPTEAELAKKENRTYETGEQLLKQILEKRRLRWKGKGSYKAPWIPDYPTETANPDGWAYIGIDAMLDINTVGMKTGPFGSMLKKHEHLLEGVPVLGIENIGPNMSFSRSSKIHVSQAKAQSLSGYEVVPGDIIISRSGTVGELCVVPEGVGEARFSTNLMRVRIEQNTCNSRYFCYLVDGSSLVLDQISDLCKGSTRLFLNQQILKSIVFPIPPLAEQARIVAEVERRLSVADALETTLTANLRRATRLRQSILKKAFSGELSQSKSVSEDLGAAP